MHRYMSIAHDTHILCIYICEERGKDERERAQEIKGCGERERER